MSTLTRSLLVSLALITSVEAHSQLPAPNDSRPGTITGVIGDSVDVGIVGATVTIVGGPGIDVSAGDGAFRIANVPAGSQTVVARRIGFRPESLTVVVVPDSILTVRLRLESTAQRVAPVVITSSRVRYTGRMRGFNERRDRGIGRFFTASDIERRRPRVVTDLLRTLPGTRLTNVNGQQVVTFRGMRCAPLVWIDGTPASVGYLDVDLFTPSSLAGIEVYPGPSTIPSELTWVRGKSNCGVIALWTKMPEGRVKQGARMSVKDIESAVQSSQLFTVDLVDTPVAQDSAHPIAPVFPDSLLRASVGGRVVAEFVVDINGEPNMATFSAVLSTHEMFTEAVRGAVSSARFTPAWRGGKRVRQLVQLPFAFSAPGKGGSLEPQLEGARRP